MIAAEGTTGTGEALATAGTSGTNNSRKNNSNSRTFSSKSDKWNIKRHSTSQNNTIAGPTVAQETNGTSRNTNNQCWATILINVSFKAIQIHNF
jgi:hypothetical protein